MASSGNFDTLSNLDNPTYDSTTNVPSQGGLKYTSSGNNQCTAQIPLTFKSYCEVRIVSISNYGGALGFGVGSLNNVFYHGSVTFQTNYSSGYIYVQNGALSGGGSQDGNAGGTVSAGDIVMMAYDPATFKWWVGKNGTWNSSGDPANGNNPVYTGSATQFSQGQGNNSDIVWGAYTSSANGLTCVFNFGQDSTFGDLETAGGNADENGHGDFKYAPPTGFLANCAANMTISDDIDPAQTEDDIAQKQFGVVTYTGNGSSNAITGLGFQPDLVWAKMRSSSQAGILIDSSRGQSLLFSSLTNAEQTSNGPFMTSYDSDGFTLSSSGSNPNDNSQTYVAWCWRANGGTTSSNTNGTITSTVQANTKAGFSIVKFTGNGSNNATVGHGLDSAPDFIICKPYGSGTLSWHVFHRAMGTGEFILNNNSAFDTRTSSFTESGTTATNFTLGSDASNMNYSGVDTIAYCWHGVEGYSKFGSYKGNGNSNGPYIRTGFRPRLIFIKNASTGGRRWTILDSARNTFNPVDSVINWDESQAEYDSSARGVDFLSNGFKIRGNDSDTNQSGNIITYGAWGDVPFKYNNTF